MKPVFRSFFFLFALTFPFSLAAQTDPIPPRTEGDSVVILDEVVLLERPVAPPVPGIAPNSLMGGNTIARLGPLDLATGLNQVSGLYVLSGALNTNRITVRGIGARTPFGTDKLKMYYNGFPVTEGSGTSTFEAYDFANLAGVEVVKGPKGTAYGNPLGGVLLLGSQSRPIGGHRFSLRTDVGSFGLFKQRVTYRSPAEGPDIHVRYNHLETEGYRINNAFDRDGLLMTGAWSPGRHRFDLLVNAIDYTAQIPSSISETDFEEDPTRAAANWAAAEGFETNDYLFLGLGHSLASLGFREDGQPHWRWEGRVFASYLDAYEARPFNILDAVTRGYGFRGRFDFGWGPARIGLGTEGYFDTFRSDTFANDFRDFPGEGSIQGERIGRNKELRDQLLFYLEGGLPLGDGWALAGGLSWNDTRYDFRDTLDPAASPVERDFDPILSPSLSLRWERPKGFWYAHWGKGFNNPGVEETLAPDGLLNPDIEQEKGTNYELGGRFDWTFLRLDFALYRMHVRDLLVAERVDEDQFIGRNAGRTRHQGLEVDLASVLDLGGGLYLNPFVSYTFNDHVFTDFRDGDSDFSGNPLTGVPRHRLNSGVSWVGTAGWGLYLNHRFVGRIPITDSNSLKSDSFHVFGAKARYGGRWGSQWHWSLETGVDNLFDTRYARSVLINATGFGGAEPRYFYPGDGRNFFIGLTLGFDAGSR